MRPGQQPDARGGGAAGGEAGLLAAVLRPLVEVEALSPGDLLEDYQAQAAVQTQELEEGRNTALKSIIEQEFAAYIVDKAAQLGAECQVEVLCAPEGEGVFLPWQVTVTGNLSPGQQEQLTAQIQEDLGVPPERQQYETKEELP